MKTSTRLDRALLLPAIVVLATTLAACSTGGADAPTATGGSTDPTSADTATSQTPTGDASSGAAAGCPATTDAVPADAAVGPTADLDGDGRPDELWLADAADGTRTLGVRTASGAVFSAAFTSAAPQAAAALGQVLGDGTAIVLLDTGRAIPLYAVIDCALVATENEQGDQYAFDKGFTGYGTGVGCEDGDAGLSLVGYLAEPDGDLTTVTSTRIELSDAGRLARNGQTSTASGLAAGDPLAVAATAVGCGDNAAPVHEPEA